MYKYRAVILKSCASGFKITDQHWLDIFTSLFCILRITGHLSIRNSICIFLVFPTVSNTDLNNSFASCEKQLI